MKAGDYLICKKTSYIFYDEKLKDRIYNRLFIKPIFKAGKKYEILYILENDTDPYVIECTRNGFKLKIKFDKEFISEHFHSKIEERKLKLKKLSK